MYSNVAINDLKQASHLYSLISCIFFSINLLIKTHIYMYAQTGVQVYNHHHHHHHHQQKNSITLKSTKPGKCIDLFQSDSLLLADFFCSTC
jgi:hypothetical protein